MSSQPHCRTPSFFKMVIAPPTSFVLCKMCKNTQKVQHWHVCSFDKMFEILVPHVEIPILGAMDAGKNPWLVVWNRFFSIQLGISSSQLTHIFQRGRYTTKQIQVQHMLFLSTTHEAMKGRPAAIFCADAETPSGEPSMKVAWEGMSHVRWRCWRSRKRGWMGLIAAEYARLISDYSTYLFPLLQVSSSWMWILDFLAGDSDIFPAMLYKFPVWHRWFDRKEIPETGDPVVQQAVLDWLKIVEYSLLEKCTSMALHGIAVVLQQTWPLGQLTFWRWC